MIQPKVWFDNAAARIAAAGSVAPGESAGDRDTGNVFLRTSSGWYQIAAAGAALIADRPVMREFFINTGGYIYEGYAVWGSATSAAAWQMFRTPASGGATERADGGNFSQIADNYASLTYAAT